MPNAIENPLGLIELGSIVTESGNYGATVLNPGLTHFIHQQDAKASMSGTSSYVYSDKMNQGSFSCAASVGVSGLAKVSGAIAGYIGNTAAKSDKTLSINLNLIKWAGVEHVNFNEISAAQLLAGLQSNAQAAAAAVLAKFVSLEQAKKDKKSDEEVAKLTEAWVLASERFFAGFGTGLVVGVVWGGWGTVSLDFRATGEESKWQGGVSASFSYAGPTWAGDLSATYGHSEDTIGQKATATVGYFVSGTCVDADIKAWFEDLKTKAAAGLTALGKEPVSRAAAMTNKINPPKIPAFKKPKPAKKITDLIDKIDSVDGLEAYAQAAAFEKQKKKAGGTKNLADFLKSAKKPNDVSAIPTGTLSPHQRDDEVIVLGHDADAGHHGPGRRAEAMAGFDEKPAPHGKPAPHDKPEPPAEPDMSDYEPMGIWTIEWGQLFPWLVSGRDNRIPPNAAFRNMIRLKTMHQDFLSLSRLYARIDAAGAKFTLHGNPVDFKSISNAFANGAAVVADFFTTSGPGAEAKVRAFIDTTIEGLGADAGAIYETWDKFACLRQCELGAGMIFTIPAREQRYTIGSVTIGQDHLHLNAASTKFDLKAVNFYEFSQAVKCWPFVLPDRRVVVLVTDGRREASGILVGNYFDPTGASMKLAGDLAALPSQARDQDGVEYTIQGSGSPLVFEEGNSMLRGCTMSSKPDRLAMGHKTIVEVYPIPFTAAKGIEWKGCAVTTGMGTLPQTLKDLRGQLSKVHSWSFDSEHWAGTDWKEFRYSMQMRPSYIGLVDEPKNVFGRAL